MLCASGCGCRPGGNRERTLAGVMFARSAPSAVRMPAEPGVDVEARLSCLQTEMPQAVTRVAAVVEMLNVSWPSPPVPTISTRPPV